MNGFFTGHHLFSPAACRRRRMVRMDRLGCSGINVSLAMSDAVKYVGYCEMCGEYCDRGEE